MVGKNYQQDDPAARLTHLKDASLFIAIVKEEKTFSIAKYLGSTLILALFVLHSLHVSSPNAIEIIRYQSRQMNKTE